MRALVAVLVLAASAAPARASPYHIPDADAADAWELKVFGEFEDGAGERIRYAPQFDITAPIMPGLETSVTFGWGERREDDLTQRGFLDFEWAVKAELARQDDGAWASVAIEPAIIAPTGTGGLSEHHWQAELPLIVSRTFGPLELRGLVTYAHAFSSEEDDELELGALVSFDVSETFSIGAEAGRASAFDDFAEQARVFDIGMKWEFAPGYELQARVGRFHEDGEDGTECAIFFERAF